MSRKQLLLGFGLLLFMVLTAITITIANWRRSSYVGEAQPEPSSLTTPTLPPAAVEVAPYPSKVPSPVASARPAASPKASPRPSSTATPSPSPELSVDYYLKSTSILLTPENTMGASQFTQTSTWPRLRIEADFAARNGKKAGAVTYRLYEDDRLISEDRREPVDDNAYFADVYYPTARSAGKHSVKITYNEDRKFAETSYVNNEFYYTYTILPEKEPPTFTIDGPYNINGQTCMRWINLEDNMSVYTDVWAKYQIDDGAWSNKTSENPYGCITAQPGTSHTYTVHAEDLNGNVSEQSAEFTAF